jgi:haloalkane dehalogenase
VSDRFARVAIGNGGLPTGDAKISDAFLQWQKYASEQTKMNVGSLIQRAVVREMKPEEIAAYDAPFPDETYQAAALAFPQLVPTRPDDPSSQFNRDAWKNLVRFTRPFLTLFSDGDPITAGGEKILQKMIPGAQNQPHSIITDGGHFLQEDKPHEIVEHLIKFIQNNPVASKL